MTCSVRTCRTAKHIRPHTKKRNSKMKLVHLDAPFIQKWNPETVWLWLAMILYDFPIPEGDMRGHIFGKSKDGVSWQFETSPHCFASDKGLGETCATPVKLSNVIIDEPFLGEKTMANKVLVPFGAN